MGETGSRSVGSIQIRERIGSSGLYLAEQLGLRRRVAVRKLRRDLQANASLVAHLEREARLAARVMHPNVAVVFDFFSQRGDQYLVMEHVDGPNLREVLNRVGCVPPRLSALVLSQIVEGVGALHAQGIVHSDLRPENILLSRWGEVKLRGLGTAREVSDAAAEPGRELTPYSPPEQGTPLPGGDVYAVGAMLAELLTGSPHVDARKKLSGPQSSLTRLMRRCLDPRPGRRPSLSDLRTGLARAARNVGGDEARAELAAWLWESSNEDGEAVRDPEADELSAKPARRRALLLASSAALLLAGGAFLAFAPWWGAAPRPPVDAGLEDASRGLFSDLDAAVQSQDATVRFAVYPWAEVSVDRATSFLTPRARPLQLTPGPHEVVLRHPDYGESAYTLDLAPGEARVLRHAFDAAGLP